MIALALLGLFGCVPAQGERPSADADVLDALGPPVASGDLVLTAASPDGAVLEVRFDDAPLAATAGRELPRSFLWPLELEDWGAVALTVEGRVYEGIDGTVLLEVRPGDPPVVDVFVEGAVLLGDSGAVAVPWLYWQDVPAG